MTYAKHAYEMCDKVLQYLFDNKTCLRTDIEYAFKPNNIFPALDELTEKKFIGHNSMKSHYHIKPEGRNIIDTYSSYSAYILSITNEKEEQQKLTTEQRKDIPKNARNRTIVVVLGVLAILIPLLLWIIDKLCKTK